MAELLLLGILVVYGAFLYALRKDRRPNRLIVAVVPLAVATAAVLNIVRSSRHGEHPGDAPSAMSLALLALPAAIGPALTRGRILRSAASLLAFLAWFGFLFNGDLTCTDCQFALGIPLSLALPQVALVIVSRAAWTARRPRFSSKSAKK